MLSGLPIRIGPDVRTMVPLTAKLIVLATPERLASRTAWRRLPAPLSLVLVTVNVAALAVANDKDKQNCRKRSVHDPSSLLSPQNYFLFATRLSRGCMRPVPIAAPNRFLASLMSAWMLSDPLDESGHFFPVVIELAKYQPMAARGFAERIVDDLPATHSLSS